MSVLTRIPVVGGLAYIEHVRRQPSTFEATLVAEPGNRFFPQAIAVTVGEQKLGYVAPEVAREWFDAISAAIPPPVCPARRGQVADHETSGVELLLDFSGLAGPGAR